MFLFVSVFVIVFCCFLCTVRKNTNNALNRSIWYINRSQTSTTSVSQSNGNKEVHPATQNRSLTIWCSLVSYPGDLFVFLIILQGIKSVYSKPCRKILWILFQCNAFTLELLRHFSSTAKFFYLRKFTSIMDYCFIEVLRRDEIYVKRCILHFHLK